MTLVLHTARISNVDSVMFVNRMLSLLFYLQTLLILAVCKTRVMNFVIDLAHHRVSKAHWQRIGARNPKV